MVSYIPIAIFFTFVHQMNHGECLCISKLKLKNIFVVFFPLKFLSADAVPFRGSVTLIQSPLLRSLGIILYVKLFSVLL